MKTIIYYNVNSGEAFDAEGRIRTANNPFTAAYGEKRIFEWRLITDNTAPDPSTWPAFTDFEHTPTIASAATDNSYVSAYKGTLASVTSGTVSEVAVTTSATGDEVASTGEIRLKLADGTESGYDYTAAVKTETGFTFSIDEDLETVTFLENSPVDILKRPMAKADTLLDSSDVQNGIFAFAILFQSEKLKKIFEYSDSESFTTKGLELRVAGLDDSNLRVELAQAIVPLTILGVLDQTDLGPAVSLPPLNEYQTWARGLIAAGIEVQFSSDQETWTDQSTGATHFRLRPAGVDAAVWSSAITLAQPAAPVENNQLHYEFTVPSGNTESIITITLSDLGVTTWSKLQVGLYKLQSDFSEMDITKDQNLQIKIYRTKVTLTWTSGAFPQGTYYLRS